MRGGMRVLWETRCCCKAKHTHTHTRTCAWAVAAACCAAESSSRSCFRSFACLLTCFSNVAFAESRSASVVGGCAGTDEATAFPLEMGGAASWLAPERVVRWRLLLDGCCEPVGAPSLAPPGRWKTAYGYGRPTEKEIFSPPFSTACARRE